MSICSYNDASKLKKEVDLSQKKPIKQKALEEEEYLDRVASIIKRDFFSEPELDQQTPSASTLGSERSRISAAYLETPGRDRTNFTSTSSVRSRRQACSLRLNDFFAKYTSEDNAYFEKLQRKDLKRHRLKYPWLHSSQRNHNELIKKQLKLPSLQEQATIGESNSATKMIDWPYNPKSALFYGAKVDDERNNHEEQSTSRGPTSTVNYNSNKCLRNPIFKEPLPIKQSERTSSVGGNGAPVRRFADKIGIDGKLVGESQDGLPSVNGYAFIPPPDSPRQVISEAPRIKLETTNRFYIPGDSPRDDLAHRLYEEKVGKNIRTPKSNSRANTPKGAKSGSGFYF